MRDVSQSSEQDRPAVGSGEVSQHLWEQPNGNPNFTRATFVGMCGRGEVCLVFRTTTGKVPLRLCVKDARFLALVINHFLAERGMADSYSQSEIDSGRLAGDEYVSSQIGVGESNGEA